MELYNLVLWKHFLYLNLAIARREPSIKLPHQNLQFLVSHFLAKYFEASNHGGRLLVHACISRRLLFFLSLVTKPFHQPFYQHFESSLTKFLRIFEDCHQIFLLIHHHKFIGFNYIHMFECNMLPRSFSELIFALFQQLLSQIFNFSFNFNFLLEFNWPSEQIFGARWFCQINNTIFSTSELFFWQLILMNFSVYGLIEKSLDLLTKQ